MQRIKCSVYIQIIVFVTSFTQQVLCRQEWENINIISLFVLLWISKGLWKYSTSLSNFVDPHPQIKNLQKVLPFQLYMLVMCKWERMVFRCFSSIPVISRWGTPEKNFTWCTHVKNWTRAFGMSSERFND